MSQIKQGNLSEYEIYIFYLTVLVAHGFQQENNPFFDHLDIM